MASTRTIKLLDSNFHDGKTWQPGVSLSIPPRRVRWDREGAERFTGLVVVTDHHLSTPISAGRKVAWLVESPDVIPDIYDPSKTDFSRFHKVVTFHRGLLQALPNSVEGLMGGCHVRESDIGIHRKEKLVSMIGSSKNFTSGHRFRCDVASLLVGSVDLFGKGRERTLRHKADGLLPYAFSVAVENGREPDYFSEKLIDCFLTGTIPIYWGVKSIGNWFNLDGVLAFDTEQEAKSIVNELTMDKYLKKIPSIADNFMRAQRFVCPEDDMEQKGYFL